MRSILQVVTSLVNAVTNAYLSGDLGNDTFSVVNAVGSTLSGGGSQATADGADPYRSQRRL